MFLYGWWFGGFEFNSTQIFKKLSPKFLFPIKLLKCTKLLKEHETKSPKLVEVEQVKVRIPINIVKVGDIGYRFRKNFKGFGIFEGCVIEIKTHAENNKHRRCWYTDGNSEDFSSIQIRSYKRLTSTFLSPVKVLNNQNPLEKSDLSDVENKDLDIYTSIHVSSILPESNHEQCLENSISNEDEESVISDNDPKSFAFEDNNIKSISNNIAFISQIVHSLRSESKVWNLI